MAGRPEKSTIGFPRAVALGPDGTLYFGDAPRVRRVAPALPGLGAGDVAVADAEANEVYGFDAAGRHLQTREARTGATLYEFGYDDGRLVTIADAAGNLTTIERDSSGTPERIVGPFGQTTLLTLDANGYLETITNPAAETTGFAYTPDGLLTALTDARGHTWTLTYAGDGRLASDTDPAGGRQTFSRTSAAAAYAVARTVAMTATTARSRTYRVERLPSGEERRTTTDAAGLETTTLRTPSGDTTTTAPDGTVTETTTTPDPRFGMQAPRQSTTLLVDHDNPVATVPGEIRHEVTVSRAVTLANLDDPLSVQTQTDTVTINGFHVWCQTEPSARTRPPTPPAFRRR
jgi:YD repeat-containing protein